MPEWLTPLGPTVGWPLNGAVSNCSPSPLGVSTLRRELRAGGFDVVHLQEPVAPMAGWDTLTSADAPLVGTFHCYSESALPHKTGALLGARRKLNRLNVSIAVSEAAAWTGRRFYGGRYRIIPNGVVLPDGGVPAPRARAAGEPLRIVFVGQAVERKGLPVLLRAFEALRGQVPAELTVIGLTPRGAGAAARRGRGRDRARARGRRGQGRRAARRRRAVRAVARRRVVRDGPDGGVRGRARRSSPPTSPATATW